MTVNRDEECDEYESHQKALLHCGAVAQEEVREAMDTVG
jgi:hypothetical protein